MLDFYTGFCELFEGFLKSKKYLAFHHTKNISFLLLMETKNIFFLVQDFLNNFFGTQHLTFDSPTAKPKIPQPDESGFRNDRQ